MWVRERFHLRSQLIFLTRTLQTNPVTLTRFIMEETEADHTGRIYMAFIFQSIAVAAKVR